MGLAMDMLSVIGLIIVAIFIGVAGVYVMTPDKK
jgi:hypothetical protein